MEPLVFFTASATPWEPWAPWPPGAVHFLPPSKVQTEGAVPVRNLVKLSVVPESSERWIVAICRFGRVTPGLSFAMAGSFQFLIVPAKILASVSGVSCRLWRLGTLYATPIGPTTIGRLMATLPLPQRALAL